MENQLSEIEKDIEELNKIIDELRHDLIDLINLRKEAIARNAPQDVLQGINEDIKKLENDIIDYTNYVKELRGKLANLRAAADIISKL